MDTALQCTAGVVSVRVAAGASEEKILADSFKAITRANISILDHSGGARRVLWWHHYLFRTPATVVLRAAERKSEPFAALDGAARALTHDFGARVLIDASNNSLPDAATATKREDILDVEPMPRELLEEIPELQQLHEALVKADLADVVWMCVGGNPADYKRLLTKWTCQPNDLDEVVAIFVRNLLGKAMENVSNAVANDERLQVLFDNFRENSAMPSAILKDMKLVRPSPDKVLRTVTLRAPAGRRGGGQRILIPADAATVVVLRHELTVTPTMDELKALAMPVRRGDEVKAASATQFGVERREATVAHSR